MIHSAVIPNMGKKRGALISRVSSSRNRPPMRSFHINYLFIKFREKMCNMVICIVSYSLGSRRASRNLLGFLTIAAVEETFQFKKVPRGPLWRSSPSNPSEVAFSHTSGYEILVILRRHNHKFILINLSTKPMK